MSANVWEDPSGVKVLSEDIIRMMPNDEEDPIRQILYFGQKDKFEAFKQWHGIDKTGVYTRLMPCCLKHIDGPYLYGFNYTIIVISDDISVTIEDKDIPAFEATHSQVMKEIEFPDKWFQNKLKRTKEKADKGYKTRFELLDLTDTDIHGK